MPPLGDLYERVANGPAVPAGLPLVILLTGFTDAGSAVSGLIDYARDELDSAPIAIFSNDALLDYRARRPIVSFEEDHLTDYQPQRLELSLSRDALGQPFLLLAGYEPDFAWDAFSAAILRFADVLEVSTVTWVHAISMPVPHTRPIGTTVSGTREDLTAAHSVWRPHTQVPATAGHLLEYRFAAAGARISGFVLLIPHYLADTEYPAATIAAMDRIMTATGLVFTADDLREENREYIAKVDEQVEGNEELSRMVRGLEERYDAYMAGMSGGVVTPPLLEDADLPSADELAAELERYLASRPSPDDDKRGGGVPPSPLTE
ncbi:MAG TPA: PAC2 family protein [Microbacterium sp.]|uniref:proteasome assembly chaperone family protein n=1 Tax=Microbacterium sp. TaxID=51671 RepID=UPI002B76929C|nr:PAC2 family protein [Microbacterium sp.]HWI32013.1 PAC2 family protein [Microbacterium sp.]